MRDCDPPDPIGSDLVETQHFRNSNSGLPACFCRAPVGRHEETRGIGNKPDANSRQFHSRQAFAASESCRACSARFFDSDTSQTETWQGEADGRLQRR